MCYQNILEFFCHIFLIFLTVWYLEQLSPLTKKNPAGICHFFTYIFLFLLIGVHSIINHSFFLFLFINVKCLFFHLHIFKINRITLYTTGVTQFLQAIDRRSTYSGRGVWARTFAK